MAFEPPEHWTRLLCIDAHTAGEPLRVITAGYPELPGDTMLAKRRYAREHYDRLRRALMLEPRGHADMYGCVLTAPVTRDGDVGVLFLHNEGYSTMCGHGIIGLVKVGIDCGLLRVDPSDGIVRIDTPAGRVTATAEFDSGGSVAAVRFLNVPSFVVETQGTVDVEGLGSVEFDLAFGGAFYAYVDATRYGLVLDAAHVGELIATGRAIKHSVAGARRLSHPTGGEDLEFLYGTIFVGPSTSAHSRNVCIFADGEVDRSPTGTGVSGRAALLHASGELDVGEVVTIESILGTSFDVSVAEVVDLGGTPAVVPEVSGTAHIVGRSEHWLDPEDPLCDGFLLR